MIINRVYLFVMYLNKGEYKYLDRTGKWFGSFLLEKQEISKNQTVITIGIY